MTKRALHKTHCRSGVLREAPLDSLLQRADDVDGSNHYVQANNSVQLAPRCRQGMGKVFKYLLDLFVNVAESCHCARSVCRQDLCGMGQRRARDENGGRASRGALARNMLHALSAGGNWPSEGELEDERRKPNP